MKIGLRKWNYFGVNEFFSVNFDFENKCKNEFQDNNEKSAADSKVESLQKIDFRADGTQESHPTAWELKYTWKKLFFAIIRIFINPFQFFVEHFLMKKLLKLLVICCRLRIKRRVSNH